MTDWPDDWFRDSPPKAGAGQPGSAAPGNAAPGSGADITAPRAIPGAAAGRRLTVHVPVPQAGQRRPAGPAGKHRAGKHRAAGGQAQPTFKLRSTKPPRRTRGPGSGIPASGIPGSGIPGMPGNSGRSGWRRWLRPRRILAVLAVLLSLALIGSIGTYFYLDSMLTRKNVLVDYPSRACPGLRAELADHRIGQQARADRRAATPAQGRLRHRRSAL